MDQIYHHDVNPLNDFKEIIINKSGDQDMDDYDLDKE